MVFIEIRITNDVLNEFIRYWNNVDEMLRKLSFLQEEEKREVLNNLRQRHVTSPMRVLHVLVCTIRV